MSRGYRYISADAHLEGAGLDEWPLRVPEQHRDRAPRRIRMPGGGYGVMMEGSLATNKGLGVFAGTPPEEYRPEEPRHMTDVGSGPPEQRVREQDKDGIDAEVLFTGVSGPRQWRGIKDNEPYLAIVRAYNDWLAEDYCAVAPDRLIGLGVIPQVDTDHAIAEMEHCAKLGLKGVVLGSFPSGESKYPTPEDDKFWAAAIDLNMPLTVHVSLSGGERSQLVFKYPKQPQGDLAFQSPFHSHPIHRLGRYALAGGGNAVQLIIAGVFDRFPKLKLFFAENQIGWIPSFLETMDYDYKNNKYWAERLFGVKQLPRLPSEYIREHFWWSFWYNPIGIELRHHVGVDHIMWGSDFPHIVTAWPDSVPELEEQFTGVPEEEKYKMVCGNAIEFFHLD